MSAAKWTGLSGPITAQLAEAEPEHMRLFNQPPRPVSRELAALLAKARRQSVTH